MIALLSSGYCALDVIQRGDAIGHHGGGTAANVAAAAAHLGLSTAFAGRLGIDAPAELILRDLAAADVDIAMVEHDAAVATPVVMHQITAKGHRFRFSCPVCGRDFAKHRPITSHHANVILGSETPQIFFFDRASAPCLILAARFRAAGAVIVFEPSTPGDLHRTIRAAELAHLVKWSVDRRPRLHPELFDSRQDQWQLETAGADGLRVRQSNDPWTYLAGFAVETVDSAGAGDWLSAALLSEIGGRLRSVSLHEMVDSLARAQAIAALNCLGSGARALVARPREAIEREAAALIQGTHAPTPPPDGFHRRTFPDTCSVCLAPAPVLAA
jgi:sugar/nucleoside kinase (ribokinase family)